MKKYASLSFWTKVSLFLSAPAIALANPLPPTFSVPDSASTFALLTSAIVGVFAARRFFSKKN